MKGFLKFNVIKGRNLLSEKTIVDFFSECKDRERFAPTLTTSLQPIQKNALWLRVRPLVGLN
jgi:hypothetical protein